MRLGDRLVDLPEPDEAAVAAVHARAADILRPPGALQWLDDLAAWIAGWQRRPLPIIERPVGLVFAADHGVAAAAKVSALEPKVTAAMFAAFAEGRSTIRSFARHAGATVTAIDVGVGKPTGDIRVEAAMSEERFAEIVDTRLGRSRRPRRRPPRPRRDGHRQHHGVGGRGGRPRRRGDGGVGRPRHRHRRRHAERQARRGAAGGAPHRRRHRSARGAARGRRLRARRHRRRGRRRPPPITARGPRRLRRHGVGAAARARSRRRCSTTARSATAPPSRATADCSTASASARCSTSTCASAKAAERWPPSR